MSNFRNRFPRNPKAAPRPLTLDAGLCETIATAGAKIGMNPSQAVNTALQSALLFARAMNSLTPLAVGLLEAAKATPQRDPCAESVEGKACGAPSVGELETAAPDGSVTLKPVCGDHTPPAEPDPVPLAQDESNETAEQRLGNLREIAAGRGTTDLGKTSAISPSPSDAPAAEPGADAGISAPSSGSDPDETVPMRDAAPVEGEGDR